jgi:hypothetical protein
MTGESLVSLDQMLPDIQLLSRVDKLRLIEMLAQDLVKEATEPLILPHQSYPVWSPDRAFSAAATMLQVLDADKERP